jgi:hypothetical protein
MNVDGFTPRDLVILVPMLGRHHRVFPLLESIDATTPGAVVMFCLTPNDGLVDGEINRAVQRGSPSRIGKTIVVRRATGDYARKINAGYRATSEPLMFLGADDLSFRPGWFEAAVAKLGPGIGVVGTNDLGSPRVMRGEHSTHSLVTRRYADEFGTIDEKGCVLYEGYPHEWVDDELVGTAKHRGAWAMALDSHVEHLHPNWGKAPADALYRQQTMRMRIGQGIYTQRMGLWT